MRVNVNICPQFHLLMFFSVPGYALSISLYCLIAKEASGPPVAHSGKMCPAAMPQTQSEANKQVCVHLGGPTVCVCVCVYSEAMPCQIFIWID